MRRRSGRSSRLGVALLVVVGGVSVAAHDMWIEPVVYVPESGKVVGLRLRVGQDFLGDPIVRDPSLFEKFIIADKTGVKNVVGRELSDPAGLIRPVEDGLLVIGYQSKPNPVVLPSAKFNQYLSEEGLDTVASLRAKRGDTEKDARELFMRCAKSLMLVGTASPAQHDRTLGFPLELTSEQNPYLMTAGGQLAFKLVYQNQPLPGALVVAVSQRHPAARISARTDKSGRVRLRLGEAGPWLIKAVHMIPAPAGSDAEWASFWASLTFELPVATAK